MVALSGTLLAVYQICVAKHDFFSSPEVTLAFFQNELLVFLDSAFLNQFLVYCVALCGMMDYTIFY
jgi:hypothetical protein